MATDWHLAHLARFAMGGAGIVFVESTAVEERGRNTHGDVGLWKDAQIAPLARIADALRSHGAVPAIQLGHTGRKAAMQKSWQGHGPLRRLLLGSVTAKVLHDVSAAVWTGTASSLSCRPDYRSIVCALDESEEAESVLKAAAAFARPFGAQLHLLHCVELPTMALEIDVSSFRRAIMDSADAKLRELKGRLGVDAPHTVTDEIMIDGIRKESLRVNADLVIVGRGRSQGLLSGIWSRMYSLIQEAPCPVLSV